MNESFKSIFKKYSKVQNVHTVNKSNLQNEDGGVWGKVGEEPYEELETKRGRDHSNAFCVRHTSWALQDGRAGWGEKMQHSGASLGGGAQEVERGDVLWADGQFVRSFLPSSSYPPTIDTWGGAFPLSFLAPPVPQWEQSFK